MNHTPGALRAAERIGKLAGFPPIMVDALAEMIDAETGARELLDALKYANEGTKLYQDHPGLYAAIIAKAEGRA